MGVGASADIGEGRSSEQAHRAVHPGVVHVAWIRIGLGGHRDVGSAKGTQVKLGLGRWDGIFRTGRVLNEEVV